MIFLKNMDRMGFIMKNKECMNCGSTQFHQVKNGWKCEYCGTIYLNTKKKSTVSQVDELPTVKKKKNLIHVSAAIPIIIMLVGLLSYSVFSSNTESVIPYQPIEPGVEDPSTKGEFPEAWTQNIYDSVKVATENYDADSEKYSFENGSSYEELERLVGKPDTVTSWEKESYGMPPRSMATWSKTSDGDYEPHSVTVTYDKETLMITDKSHY
ncbi:hypothetical protein JZO67_004078 [Enterococcus sp. 665A]|uniref:Uncharacterized protein n=2 Tax=Candidatus Enterococcus ferrettii TaxID=2815324 RepID=A0ABV0ETX3_9ENTE|nr:hypothetical protein [Enterococcus sp. 665A]